MKQSLALLGWGHHSPSSLLHLDGDGFFAACEVAMNPALKGKCVVTGAERGIASAMSYEAKARGVKRGMPLHEIRRICPEAIIVPSNYETYGVFNRRMLAIVRRYTEAVEEYSIDECFADLAGLQRPLNMSYEKIARTIKREIQNELGITVSCGLAPNKVLAKIGSKWQKPDGFTLIHQGEIEKYLGAVPIIGVWGIGPQTAAFLRQHGVETALDFARKPSVWVHAALTKPTIELWQELRGERVLPLALDAKREYQSMQHTRTFSPATADPAVLLRELSAHAEAVCARARTFGLYAKKMSFFLKTRQFRYRALEVKLPSATNIPTELIRIIARELPRLLRNPQEKELFKEFGPWSNVKGQMSNVSPLYRATGVTLSHLSDAQPTQQDLFGASKQSARHQKVLLQTDALAKRYRKPMVTLASSHSVIPHRACPRPDRGMRDPACVAQDPRLLHPPKAGSQRQAFFSPHANVTTPSLLAPSPSPFRLRFAGCVGN